MEYKVDNMKKGKWGKIVAFFDLKFIGMTSHFDMTVKGFKLIEGINGKFVSMPSLKVENDEYQDRVWVDKDTRIILNDIAVKAYETEPCISLAIKKEYHFSLLQPTHLLIFPQLHYIH